ncbi:AAA family ATPase [Rhodococcus pyridinivorans]|uniref:AAA family ATPase n=1 Tax=Rhodococcus pyridinivorans TaxID=103816 RepID=UPI0018DF6FA1|nr:AAA family ATPase [Rhodococcus pyridinivorans]
MTLYLVIGPPAAGKSTWVREHAEAGDLTIDFDALANVLTPAALDSHKHTAEVKAVARAARQAAIDAAVVYADDVDVYVIHSTPSAKLMEHYRGLGAEVVTVDPGPDVVMDRISRERPWQMAQAAKKWYSERGLDTPAVKRPTTTERGMGWDHQQHRDRLLRLHIDGTPCWWCERPMFRDPARNFDGAVLEADHSLARVNGGTVADRLLHHRCNRQRGRGTRDHLRPAVASAPEAVPEGEATTLLAWPGAASGDGG